MTPTETIDALNAEAWEKRMSDPAGAMALAAEAERLSREGSGYTQGLGWGLLTSGICALNTSEHERAGEQLAAALNLFVECGQREGEAHAVIGIGRLYSLCGDYPRALEQYQRSLGIAREMGYRSGEAYALKGKGNVDFALGKYASALEQYQASVGIFKELGDRSGEADALGNMGLVHSSLGEYRQSFQQYQASLGIAREIGNRSGEASMLNGIGCVHLSLGEYPQALEHLQASLGVSREIGNRSAEANTLGNIGLVHSALGELREALEHDRASLGIFQELGDRRGEATLLSNIGVVHSSLGEYPPALEYYRASLDISREIGGRSEEANTLIGIASVHTLMREFPTALAALEAAAEIARQSGERRELGEAMLGLGQTYAAMEQPEVAVASLEAAISLAVELGGKPMELTARGLVWQQYRLLGNLSSALENLLRYTEIREELLGEETRRTIQKRETMLQIEIARKGAEIERLRNVELKQAFERLERSHQDLNQAHTELKSAQSQLVQSEKMASLGQLTAGIAHEINNPINFVSASIGPVRRNLEHLRTVIEELICRVPRDERLSYRDDAEIDETLEELRQLIANIETGAGRTAEIVSSLRSFSRLDEGGQKCVDLHEGLEATLTILSGSMSEGIELVREYGDLPAVECYPGEINQVFMNILTNAIKAIDGEGRVTIQTRVEGDRLLIAIADTGVGITPEVQSRIFEPFFTTRDVGQGKGLGLSIAWGIVEKHGGTIEVTSTPGSGSTFAVTLPIRQEQS
jgi:two-component system, NtrC family, sensor kinase